MGLGYNYGCAHEELIFFLYKGSREGTFDKAFRVMEKYSSGRRGAPAKGVDRETDARVQIPPSPFLFWKIKFFKKVEKRY